MKARLQPILTRAREYRHLEFYLANLGLLFLLLPRLVIPPLLAKVLEVIPAQKVLFPQLSHQSIPMQILDSFQIRGFFLSSYQQGL